MKPSLKFIGFILWLLPQSIFGQRIINGQIIDSENYNPIHGASVFISNTTIGTTTNCDGYYSLRVPEDGSYQLTVSHVGYKSVSKYIENGNAYKEFNISLHINELDEVTVASRVRFRQRDINIFWKTILGKNPTRNTIRVTNPEAVYYFYNPETQILKVTCREPLHIINYETGYHIQYILNHFIYNHKTDIADWSHQYIFTELESANFKQKENWEKKRKEVYQISLVKFIKSLYNNSLHNDGFVLTQFYKNPDSGNPYHFSLINPDTILSIKLADNSKVLNFFNQKIMLICFGRPVTNNDLSMLKLPQSNSFLQRNVLLMNLLQGDSIRIYPDGTYANNMLFAAVNSSNTISGLSMMLPLDYLPKSSTLSITQDTIVKQLYDIDTIVQFFDNQLSILSQEKIHIHTDRDYYEAGEKIWFKAYLIDAHTHLYPTHSRYVYVELISPNDSVVSRAMIRASEDDMFYGNISSHTNIPKGNYTLRAYTRYMENLGDDYFFNKNIRIETPHPDPLQRRGSLKRNGDDFDVSFFPEGGNLVESAFCRVAFKALNRNGFPEIIFGKLVDENGTEITSVKTFYAGMGVFTYIPEQGKSYFVKCQNGNGLEKQFELPQPNPHAHALTALWKNNRLYVGVQKSASTQEIPVFLLIHSRGRVLYFAQWDNRKENIFFVEEQFPAGVIQFVLFDNQMNPLSERLVFSKNFTNDMASLEFSTDKVLYEKREKVIATIREVTSLSPSLSERGQGVRCSVAITDDTDIAIDSSTTILSTFLLSSELKGYINNPAYYLQNNSESATALDYLMMTHGWRRYNIPDVIKGNPTYPQIPYQTSQEISGSVKSLAFSKPVANSEISMMTKEGFVGLTTSDEKGTFMFQGFEYPDSTLYFIQALSSKGSDRVELVLNDVSFPKPINVETDYYPSMYQTNEYLSLNQTDNKQSLQSNDFIAKAEQRSKYDEDLRVIHLNAVEVTAPIIERKDEIRLRFPLNAGSNFTLRREEFEKYHPPHASALLYGIPGIFVTREGFPKMRNTTGFGDPLILIDGIVSEGGVFSNNTSLLSVQEIESIDVFRGPNAALFGIRGTNGVISITTKRGLNYTDLPQRNEFNCMYYTPLGYQKPVEFYAPRYETLESKHLTIPDFRTTIFWKPDIVISDTGETSFEFYTSDFPTTYSVVIEGMTTDGRIIRQVEKIRVQ